MLVDNWWEAEKFTEPRAGPVVVQFTTETCALCPDATLKIDAVAKTHDFVWHIDNAFSSTLAEDLEVERIGPEHNAGSDSLLTQATFFKMRQLFFENELDDDKCLNCIHGLGKAYDQIA